MLLAPLVLLGWLIIAVIYLGWGFWKIRRIAPFSLQAICSAIALLSLVALPQGFWIRLFIDRFAKGPYAIQFMDYAAALGDLSTLKVFVEHGVPIDARDREGKTALYCAAVEGKTPVIAYLISKGADVNAIYLGGDSPLEEAITANHKEAAAYLAVHGAKRVKGSEEQHQQLAEKIVREDIERMDNASK